MQKKRNRREENKYQIHTYLRPKCVAYACYVFRERMNRQRNEEKKREKIEPIGWLVTWSMIIYFIRTVFERDVIDLFA